MPWKEIDQIEEELGQGPIVQAKKKRRLFFLA